MWACRLPSGHWLKLPTQFCLWGVSEWKGFIFHWWDPLSQTQSAKTVNSHASDLYTLHLHSHTTTHTSPLVCLSVRPFIWLQITIASWEELIGSKMFNLFPPQVLVGSIIKSSFYSGRCCSAAENFFVILIMVTRHLKCFRLNEL